MKNWPSLVRNSGKKTLRLFALAFLFAGIVFSCKNQSESTESSFENKASREVAAEASDETAISSNAAVENKESKHKFVRTADIKFQVKDVRKSTEAIENATTKFGGFVTYTNLQSVVTEKNETQISADSTLAATKYKVENNITIRVPNKRLDTVVKTIARQIGFLDYRVIKADDVTLQMLANEMAQGRSSEKSQRLAAAIDSKGKKLNDIIRAEDQLADESAANDDKQLENLSLKDQVSYSTLTLEIYQNESVRKEIVASNIPVTPYRPHIGLQLLDGLSTGWYILEAIIGFIVQLWSLILLAVLVFLLFRKYGRGVKVPTP
ncbi:DUF4349 domain-containing protein [Flavobacterium sp. 3HN19-14]|uniref:DUF4349 domain-containing protein n=1 Tax=Flavobacterium sp. 3HN19-14 TaxID=3448133 RepID=UPI003EE2AFBE